MPHIKRRTFLRLFYSSLPFINPVFTLRLTNLSHSFDWSMFMDWVYVAAAAGLWGAMALLVWGLKSLEAPKGGKS